MSIGKELTKRDYGNLGTCFISRDLAQQAQIRRVDSAEGAQLVGRDGRANYAGLAFPYVRPGETHPTEYQLRRDEPEFEKQPDGTLKEKNKYLFPPGRSNHLYFVPGTPEEWLKDTSRPIEITEGVKKALSLYSLAALDDSNQLGCLPVGLSGVWGWRGTIGKEPGPNGERRTVKGPIPDLDLIAWTGRLAYIIFDVNVRTNRSVQAARRKLAQELTRRGAKVLLVDLPEVQGVNGIDDLLGLWGPERVLQLFEASTPFSEEAETPNKITQAQILIKQAAGVELFHTSDHEGYATFTMGDHRENWPIRSKSFRRYLVRAFYKSEGKPPGSQALQDVLQLLEAKAQFDGAEEEVFTRVAGDQQRIYLDLANDQWTVVEITVNGWSIVANPDVKFRRASGMLPLPDPEHGGSVEQLRPLINAQSEETWVLDIAWTLGGLKPTGPYPVDITLGEQGSAKSTRQRLKRSLIDPIKAPLRSAPRNSRDLMISAKNGWIITLDNLSQLPDWLSDALCCLATLGGFATRELYTNDEEMIFESCRPIALNAIENMVHRPDLVDRALINNILPIPEDDRKTETDILAEFKKAHPNILGALLDAVVEALRNYPNVKLEKLPRMADFAKWVVAAEPALPWPSGTFLRVYNQNRSGAIETTLETDPLASAVRELMEDQEDWEGAPAKLLLALEALVDEKTTKEDGWPGSAAWLTRKLKRPATFLRSVGIDIDFPPPGKGRSVVIRKHLQNTCFTWSTCNDSHKPKNGNDLPITGKTAGKTGKEGKAGGKESLPPMLKPLPSKSSAGKTGKTGKEQPFSKEGLA